MAKIVVNLDTDELDDAAIMVAIARIFEGRDEAAVVIARGPVRELEPLAEVEAAEPAQEPAPKRTRRTKAEMEAARAAEAAKPDEAQVFASPQVDAGAAKSALFSETAQGSSAVPADDAPEISVAAVNAKITRLLDAKVPALQLQEALLEATDGKYRSANHAGNANDTAALVLIDKALETLVAAL